jgi:ribosome-binding protein aMBF1 (putative translation factor)
VIVSRPPCCPKLDARLKKNLSPALASRTNRADPQGRPDPVDAKTIGKRLRDIRDGHGMTQVQLAAKLGMPQALLSDYEHGKDRFHGGLIIAFARALKEGERTASSSQARGRGGWRDARHRGSPHWCGFRKF